ncbi:serine/threonine protein kinase [Streptomyces azureus]|uniref:Serine/threonine protein kinase n=2 Tax=Streptomyces azureus TaxID=146537 RepID=A0A0K8PLX4_STRAJ|nr:serine/threonine protein kinase [Streptomyces azureus]
MHVPKGYRVGGWEVREPMAAGAFGSVYAGRRVGPSGEPPSVSALKFLPTGTSTPRQLRHLRELAEREVKLLSRLQAPRLIRLYETLTVDDPGHPELDGATVLVLEKAEESLDALLSRTPRPRGGPELLAQICAGLYQLHYAGWVHGDLKPPNVLLMKDGSVRLADFNMAAEMEGTHAYTPAFSTPDYTPPELLWSEIGERGRQIRPAADVWAFGVLAHVVLTGSQPLPGSTPSARRDAAVRYAQGHDELRLSPELPSPWQQIIADCLARTHRERAVHDTASLLRRVESAAGTARSPRSHPLPRRWRWAAMAAAGLAALGFGVNNALAGAGETAAGAVGYDRCDKGSVCFFTERDGMGEMCAWDGDDNDWTAGENHCGWAAPKKARSVFNNGHDTDAGEEFVDVAYYAQKRLREPLGCVEVGARENFTAPLRIRSHIWEKKCRASDARPSASQPSEIRVRGDGPPAGR